MHPENEKGRGLAGHSGGNVKTQQVYPPAANLSRLQELVVSLLIMAQSANLDTKDHAMAWSWFDQTLRQYVEVRHGT